MTGEIQVKGFVAYYGSKEGTSNGRAWKSFSMKIQDPETGEEMPMWYQLGFEDANLVVGDYIRFLATPHDNKACRVDIKTIQKSKNAPARPQDPSKSGGGPSSSSSPSGGGSSGLSKEEWAQKDRQIVHQHSQEMAIRLVTTMLEQEALPMSVAKSKAGTTKRFEEIQLQVDKFTVKFHNDVVSLRLLDSVEDFGDVDVKAQGKLPEDTAQTEESPPDDEGFEDAAPTQESAYDDDPDFS